MLARLRLLHRHTTDCYALSVDDFLAAAIDAVRSHPRCDDAAVTFARTLESELEKPIAKNDLQFCTDGDQIVLKSALLVQHLDFVLERATTGATVGRLHEAAERYKFSSKRRVNSLVDGLVERGIVIRVTDEQDRRVRRLVPTQSMIHTARRRLELIANCISCIYPEFKLPPSACGDDRAAFPLLLDLLHLELWKGNPFLINRAVGFFVVHDAGLAIMNRLFLSCYEAAGCFSADVTFKVSLYGVAHRYGISRSHTRNLITAAIQAGYIKLVAAGDGHGIEIALNDELINDWKTHVCYFIACAKLACDLSER